jgi:hypothetical protein
MPAIATPKAMRPGVNYQYFEQTDGQSDKAKQWRKLPDFENLKPKQQGIASGLEADFRGDRSTAFAFRYRGLVQVPASGFHVLVLKSCDGSRIKFDGLIGQPGLPHALRLKDGVMEFVGEGDYLAQQKIRGDFTLTCRVDDVLSKTAGADPCSWIRLIVKQARDNTGEYFGIFQTAGAGLRGSPDTADYIGSRLSSWEYAKGHPWLRVVRRGNVFTSYSSPDGSTWTKATEWMKQTPEEVFAGVSMRTIPYRSRALFRGAVSSISLNAGAPPVDPVNPAQGSMRSGRVSAVWRKAFRNQPRWSRERRIAGCGSARMAAPRGKL